MLLVGLSVAGILIKHIRSASFYLRVHDLLPQGPGFYSFPAFSWGLIRKVQTVELFSPKFLKSWTFIRTHKSPFLILYDTFHKDIWYPQPIEQVSGPLLFFSVILFELQVVKDICMPGFDVKSYRSFSFTTSLVYISSSIIEHFNHRNKTIWISVCSFDVAFPSPDVGHWNADSSSELRYHSAVFKGIIDTFYRVRFHLH